MSNYKIENSKATIPTSIEPWLSVGNGRRAVDFYKSAFGAIEVYRLDMPDGGLVARLSIDGATFWLSGETAAEGDLTFQEDGLARMILTVADPDAFFLRALKAGASEIFPVGEDHGWRLGRLADPVGHHWEVGRPLSG
jgi:PhnB protein